MLKSYLSFNTNIDTSLYKRVKTVWKQMVTHRQSSKSILNQEVQTSLVMLDTMKPIPGMHNFR